LLASPFTQKKEKGIWSQAKYILICSLSVLSVLSIATIILNFARLILSTSSLTVSLFAIFKTLSNAKPQGNVVPLAI